MQDVSRKKISTQQVPPTKINTQQFPWTKSVSRREKSISSVKKIRFKGSKSDL